MGRIDIEFSEQFDADMAEEIADAFFEAHSSCGRWRNGRMVKYCLNAGSEDCQFCPYGRVEK